MLTLVMDLNARQDSVEALRRRARMSGQRLLETGPPIAEQLTFDNRDNPDRLRGATVATHYITYRDRFRTRHEHSMRAFYSTQKHIRVFILGTP